MNPVYAGFLPPRVELAVLDLGLEMFERAVALFHALSGLDVECPLVLGAGEAGAFEREVRDVGHLVRATGVVHARFAVGAVDEKIAAIGGGIRHLAVGNLVGRQQLVPTGGGVEIFGAELGDVHGQQDVDRPHNLGKPERREGVQDGIENFPRGATVLARPHEVLAEAVLGLGRDLGDEGDERARFGVERLAGLL